MAKSKNKLTLRFMSYKDIAKLDSNARVKKLLDIIIDNKIIILQGTLSSVEEASLIQSTMALIDRIKGFKGVELATINPDTDVGFFEGMRLGIARALIGQRDALTVIGPAAIVKDIKKDPSKIDLMLTRSF
jgi:hypothetical protein